MALSTSERRILEAVDDAEAEVPTGRGVPEDPTLLTDTVRRAVGQLPGHEFRRGVAALTERHLLRARWSVKPGGEVGRVLIERVTFLGRRAIGR